MKRPLTVATGVVAALVTMGCGSLSTVLGSGADRQFQLWVTLQATDRIAVFDGPTVRERADTIMLPPGTGPHLTTFSPDRKYAYVSGMTNGDLDIISTATHKVATTLHLGNAATHQAKPSPDGSMLLVAQVASKSLIKIRADEAGQTWVAGQSLSFAALGRAPICTIFSDDGSKAFVSLNPNGLAVVDVASMTVERVIATNGFIACGMVKSANGKLMTFAASGGGGHIYRLDIATEQLSDLGTLGAVDWHSFNMVRDGTIGFGTVPRGDELRVIDLQGSQVTTLAAIPLDPTPGLGNDQPDNMGVFGDHVYVSLRMSGKLAVVNFRTREVTYIDVAPPAATINASNCFGCAVHGVAVLI